MIEAPPVLTLQRDFERPDPKLLAQLEGVPTSLVADALGGRGAMDYRIKPLPDPGGPKPAFVGTALTCGCGPGDNLAVIAALARAQPGDVIVASTDACVVTALIGDRVMGMALNAGVRALVTDGLLRDVEGINAVGLPVYSRGVSPNSPACNGPGSVGLPITLGGVSVDSGDVIVGDRDGVVVVPRARLASVVAQLPAIREAEAALEARIADGLAQPELLSQLYEAGKVQEID
ncbi:MAG: RraA family protein [Alphaproteobacteria bacterium]